jgi:hypothetical protein
MRPTRRVRRWLLAAVTMGTLLAGVAAWRLAPGQAAREPAWQCPWDDCGSEKGAARHRQRLERARAGLAAGQRWFVELGELEHDETWLLKHLLCARPDPALWRRVHEERERLRHIPPRGRLLDHASPGIPLTADFLAPHKNVVETKGLAHMFMGAILGDPEKEARLLLKMYSALDLDGYYLTHQLLALLWWEEIRGPLWGDLEEKRGRVLGRIAREHLEDPEFSDLYAERAMILALFGGRQCPADLPEWTDIVLDAQEPEGCWEDVKKQGPPDVEGCWAHTAVLALAVVQAYVDCLEPHPDALGFVPWRGLCGKDGPWPGW